MLGTSWSSSAVGAVEYTDEEIALVAALLSLRVGDQLPDMGMQREWENAGAAGAAERLGIMRPVLNYNEDAHWIDPTSPGTGFAHRSQTSTMLLLIIGGRNFSRPAELPHVTTITLTGYRRRQGWWIG